MSISNRFIRVDFQRFKAFNNFVLHLKSFNILVGPNNAGKSTIIAAFRILAAAMRKASTRKPERVEGPNGNTYGYKIDLNSISIAEENIYFNYDDSQPAKITFYLSNGNKMILYFPEANSCLFILDAQGKPILSTTTFKSNFNCPIGFVPILGPVEHNESLFEMEAARNALFNYKAARNFRNIWYHYPERFEEFRSTLIRTWPGMDIEKPKIDTSHGKPKLYMFCPEERIPREIFWAGFGFQVWCQMLTHVIQSSEAALFLIDEPDIYLHSDLQRQLLGILKNLGPDIIIATHSTEIITEADTNEIVLIDKKKTSAKRIKNPSQLGEVFSILGSNINPILTQLAKTRKALFVEGKDFQILGKFAKKLKVDIVSNRSEFAVIPVEGFNPERIRSLKIGMEFTLGVEILVTAIMDKDYRSNEECLSIIAQCKNFCDNVIIHKRKEIENFLLVPEAIRRAISRKIEDTLKRIGKKLEYPNDIGNLLDDFAISKKHYLTAQYLEFNERFARSNSTGQHKSTINEQTLNEFESRWGSPLTRLEIIPGKEALSVLNQDIQKVCGLSLTPTAIIEAMHVDEVPEEMHSLIKHLLEFSSAKLS
ncbi:hypothetical protein Lsan_1010 [Legionella santicrucis]|uniref:ATPase AAA-type core domain-containing protein n=1 Tax=Legionella santicrucis TaxID=45074 RepID=A0A0W0Z366_9GAMM|nr:ATP-binding protein [Legionella santicrucis]KTD63577.1 hypothetical protein Lsan_1010 [Legionella santicrucis]